MFLQNWFCCNTRLNDLTEQTNFANKDRAGAV